jgi:hypothetical protein
MQHSSDRIEQKREERRGEDKEVVPFGSAHLIAICISNQN